MLIVGLVLQVLGIVVACVALVQELRARSSMAALTLKRKPASRKNPWKQKSGARFRRPPGQAVLEHRMRVFNEAAGQLDRRAGDDPAVMAAVEYLVDHMTRREKQAADDWGKQRAEYVELHQETVRLFDLQSQQLVEQQARVESRVRWEFGGLLLAMFGTLISGIAGL